MHFSDFACVMFVPVSFLALPLLLYLILSSYGGPCGHKQDGSYEPGPTQGFLQLKGSFSQPLLLVGGPVLGFCREI